MPATAWTTTIQSMTACVRMQSRPPTARGRLDPHGFRRTSDRAGSGGDGLRVRRSRSIRELGGEGRGRLDVRFKQLGLGEPAQLADRLGAQ